jgi:3-methyladenine DNA glycosylase AlkD
MMSQKARDTAPEIVERIGMTAEEILSELKALGSESYKKMMMTNYGVKEPCFGVKIGDMKKIEKRIKKNYQLALDLYKSGNYDAMYLAGLIADDRQMTRKDLERWVNKATCGALPGFTVAWVAAGSQHGWKAGMEWIESAKPHIAETGWSTLASLVALKADSELDMAELKRIMSRVQKSIHTAPDVARYAMNRFLIAVGSHVEPLSGLALEIAEKIGPLTANLGHNACQIPYAPESIRKVAKRGSIGKKRKSVKC